MRLRAAKAGDTERLQRLFDELATGDPAPPPASWDAWRDGIRVLEDGGEILGYALVVGFTLRHLAVDARARGRGYGRALLEAAAGLLVDAGYDRWELQVKADNAAAIALYRASGFACVGETEALWVRRDITAPGGSVDERLSFDEAAGIVRALRTDDARVALALVGAVVGDRPGLPVLVEDQPALRRGLLAAGAEVKFRILRMEGAVAACYPPGHDGPG